MARRYTVFDGRLTLYLAPTEEGGYVVTTPIDPELVTEADDLADAFVMARDALAALRASRVKRYRRLRAKGPRSCGLARRRRG